eukprot:362896-Chlamydomonas_euryale.AAC.2
MSECIGSSRSEGIEAVDTPASKRIKSISDVATQVAGVKTALPRGQEGSASGSRGLCFGVKRALPWEPSLPSEQRAHAEIICCAPHVHMRWVQVSPPLPVSPWLADFIWVVLRGQLESCALRGRYRVFCVTQEVGMIFLHAQSSAPVSVTVHPAEGAPFTVHLSEQPWLAGVDVGVDVGCVDVFGVGVVVAVGGGGGGYRERHHAEGNRGQQRAPRRGQQGQRCALMLPRSCGSQRIWSVAGTAGAWGALVAVVEVPVCTGGRGRPAEARRERAL